MRNPVIYVWFKQESSIVLSILVFNKIFVRSSKQVQNRFQILFNSNVYTVHFSSYLVYDLLWVHGKVTVPIITDEILSLFS